MSNATTPPSPEAAGEDVEMRLTTVYGSVSARMYTNPANGRRLYEIRGARVGGSLTILPHMWPGAHETVPSGVEVAFGNLLASDIHARHNSYDYLPNPTTVNGVRILGSNTTTIKAVEEGTFSTYGRRRGSERADGRLTDAAQGRLTNVVLAVLRDWLTRPDVEELRLVVARASVPGLLRGKLRAIEGVQEELSRLRNEERLHLEQAEDFRRFLTDHRIISEKSD